MLRKINHNTKLIVLDEDIISIYGKSLIGLLGTIHYGSDVYATVVVDVDEKKNYLYVDKIYTYFKGRRNGDYTFYDNVTEIRSDINDFEFVTDKYIHNLDKNRKGTMIFNIRKDNKFHKKDEPLKHAVRLYLGEGYDYRDPNF